MDKINENKIKKFCYILIFINFIGVNFLKISVKGMNINLGRILMVMASIILLYILIKKRNIKELINDCNQNAQLVIKFLLLWGVFSLTSFFVTKDLKSTIINEFFLIFGIISIFLILCVIKEKEEFINILKITEVAMILNTIYALFLNFIMHEKTFGGFFYNVNDLATFFLIGIPAEIALICTERNSSKVIVLSRIAVLFIELYTFFLLDSRACNLGAILGCLLVSILIVYKRNSKLKVIQTKLKEKKVIYILILLVVLIITFLRSSIHKESIPTKHN